MNWRDRVLFLLIAFGVAAEMWHSLWNTGNLW